VKRIMEIAMELRELKKEIQNLKDIVIFRKDDLVEKRIVSLRGMAKLSVSEDELEQNIEKAKKSVFAGVKNVIRN